MKKINNRNKNLSSKKIPIEQKIPKVSLFEFVETNHKLLTVLGVFTALTVFSFNLSLPIFGYALSFAFFTISLLVWFELWSKFPKNGSFRLSCLENIISVSIFILVFYWLIEYRSIWHQLLFLLIFMILLAIFTYVMRKFDVFKKTLDAEPGKIHWLRYSLGVFVIFVVGIFSLYISQIASPPVNNFLDQLRIFVTQLVP